MTKKITFCLWACVLCLHSFAQEITYEGRGLDAAWRVQAAERIDKYRKGELKITVMGENGMAVKNAKIFVAMQQHSFGFGTTVDARTFMKNDRYRSMVTSFFNEVVLEKDLSWKVWYSPINREVAIAAIDKFNELGIPVRGHALVCPSYQKNPEFLNQYQLDPKGLRKKINSHIKEIVSQLSGKISDWDVISEPYENREFMEFLGFNEMVEWFKLARKHDSDAALFINDSGILSDDILDAPHQDEYYDNVNYIDGLGGGIQGIGLQSNFSNQLVAPTKLYETLEHFGGLGKELKITAFDVNINQPEVQADYTRDFITLAFSHPKVTSILTNGVWGNSEELENVAMFTKTWMPKPNYEAFRKLIYEDWWTKPVSYEATRFSKTVPGFLGTYDIIALYKEKVYKKTVVMNAPSKVTDVVFQLNDDNQTETAIMVYPNISKDIMVVSGLIKDIKRNLKWITLTDISGNIVHKQNIPPIQKDSTVLNFDGPEGLYVMRLLDEQGKLLYVTKVIKNAN